jgi:hypothetical protein
MGASWALFRRSGRRRIAGLMPPAIRFQRGVLREREARLADNGMQLSEEAPWST